MLAGKLLLVGGLIAIGGAASLAFGLSAYRANASKRDWPIVPGTIVSSGVHKVTQARLRHAVRGETPPAAADYRTEDRWAIEARYAYNAKSGRREGETVGSSPLTERAASSATPSPHLTELAKKFPPNATVDVHVNPVDDRDTYLVFTESPDTQRLLRIGGALLLLGTAVIVGSRFLGPR